MDEGPERTRLHLRPNRDFYDTYEVLAPAPSSSSPTAASAAAAAATGVAQAAVGTKGDSVALSSPPDASSTEASTGDAAIAALVKTMNASVGVVGKGGPGAKQPLTSVYDLDDTDCSALLELEELHLEDAAPGGGEDVS